MSNGNCNNTRTSNAYANPAVSTMSKFLNIIKNQRDMIERLQQEINKLEKKIEHLNRGQ